jgi:hypothetical protein
MFVYPVFFFEEKDKTLSLRKWIAILSDNLLDTSMRGVEPPNRRMFTSTTTSVMKWYQTGPVTEAKAHRSRARKPFCVKLPGQTPCRTTTICREDLGQSCHHRRSFSPAAVALAHRILSFSWTNSPGTERTLGLPCQFHHIPSRHVRAPAFCRSHEQSA